MKSDLMTWTVFIVTKKKKKRVGKKQKSYGSEFEI